MKELEKRLAFIQEAEGLKSVARTAMTAAGQQDSTAEHSWRLALLGWAMADLYPALDRARVLELCLIHDLGERYCGDSCASDLPDQAVKYGQEREGLLRLAGLLPAGKGEELIGLWEEYNEASTPEARLVKALDKAETILQHNQGRNPPDFDYDFNLEYGSGYFRGDPILEELRDFLDAGTRGRMEEQGRG